MKYWEQVFGKDTFTLLLENNKSLKERDIEIAKKLLKRNRPVDEIVEDTGLTYEEVEDLPIKS